LKSGWKRKRKFRRGKRFFLKKKIDFRKMIDEETEGSKGRKNERK